MTLLLRVRGAAPLRPPHHLRHRRPTLPLPLPLLTLTLSRGRIQLPMLPPPTLSATQQRQRQGLSRTSSSQVRAPLKSTQTGTTSRVSRRPCRTPRRRCRARESFRRCRASVERRMGGRQKQKGPTRCRRIQARPTTFRSLLGLFKGPSPYPATRRCSLPSVATSRLACWTL